MKERNRMSKRGQKVLVDMGYMGEHWEEATVVDEMTSANLFDSTKKEKSLLVEIPSGEKIWVHTWREV